MNANALWFFAKHAMWHVISQNSAATSCRDAAYKRQRLGHKGIPLYDELKSIAVKTVEEGSTRYILLHCRANAFFNFEKVKKLLETSHEIIKLDPSELQRVFASEYGTVNPFHESQTLIQIFDEDIFNFYTIPQTLMTNAGDLNLAVEFDPFELVEVLKPLNKKILIGNISTVNDTRTAHPQVAIGILTGNGPESGMALWRKINDSINNGLKAENRMYGDLSYPKVIVHSIPEMGLSMEMDKREEQVWRHLEKAVLNICKSGVHYLALACHTTQYFENDIKKICRKHDVVFYSIADVVLEYMQAHNINNLTIFAIPIVANLGKYSAYTKLKEQYGLNIKSMKPDIEKEIEELGYLIKTLASDEKNSKAINMLGNIIKNGSDGGTALIALTEISVLLERFPKIQKKGKIAEMQFIDGLFLYANRFAELYLKSLPK